MNADKLLISMGRYLHAMHDIELDLTHPKLNVKIKRYVEKMSSIDEVLKSYWEDYIVELKGKRVVKLSEPQVNKKPPKQVIYRGQIVSANDEAELLHRIIVQSNKNGILYRGSKR